MEFHTQRMQNIHPNWCVSVGELTAEPVLDCHHHPPASASSIQQQPAARPDRKRKQKQNQKSMMASVVAATMTERESQTVQESVALLDGLTPVGSSTNVTAPSDAPSAVLSDRGQKNSKRDVIARGHIAIWRKLRFLAVQKSRSGESGTWHDASGERMLCKIISPRASLRRGRCIFLCSRWLSRSQ